jgi:hypothetical protein
LIEIPDEACSGVCLAIALLFTGTPHSVGVTTVEIVAVLSRPIDVSGIGENYIDDRILVSFPLAFELAYLTIFCRRHLHSAISKKNS